jgi:hypothetical protein
LRVWSAISSFSKVIRDSSWLVELRGLGFILILLLGNGSSLRRVGKKKKTIGGNAKSLFQETWNSNVP